MNIQRRFLLRVLGTVLLTVGFSTLSAAAQTQTKTEQLPLCAKCFEPTILSKSGLGTAHAIIKAKVTYKNAKDYCEQWSFAEHPDCDKQAKEMLKEENGKIHTATADCVNGKMTIADGENFIYAGLWPETDKYLAGKTQWWWGPGSYEDTGKIVGWEGPTRAPMVAATAKLLCPNGVGAENHR